MPNFAPMKLRHISLVIILLLGVGAGAWYFTSRPKDQVSRPAAGPPKDKPSSVIASVVLQQPFTESVILTGSIVADQSVELRAEVAGRITRIGFREGADVSAGQILVKLSDADLVARREKLVQQLALDNSRRSRLEKLRTVDGASLDEYESAVAQVDMRKAEIAEVDAQIAKTEVRAPFTGRVGLRNVSVGAVITPQTVLASLTSIGTLNVDCSVPERYAASLSQGAHITFRVRGADTAMRKAKILAIEPVVDVRSRTQRVRARIERTGGVTAGMFADVILALSQRNDAILVPTEAVVQDMKGANVFRVESGIARSVPVTLGSRTASNVVVESGLRNGDTVVMSGILFVKDGKPVKVTLR